MLGHSIINRFRIEVFLFTESNKHLQIISIMSRFFSSNERRSKTKGLRSFGNKSSSPVKESSTDVHDSGLSLTLAGLSIASNAASRSSNSSYNQQYSESYSQSKYHVPGTGSFATYLNVDGKLTFSSLSNRTSMEPESPYKYLECNVDKAGEYNIKLYSYLLQQLDSMHQKQSNVISYALGRIAKGGEFFSDYDVKSLYNSLSTFLSQIKIPDPIINSGMKYSPSMTTKSNTSLHNNTSLAHLQEVLIPEWINGFHGKESNYYLELYFSIKKAISCFPNIYSELKSVKDALYIPYNLMVHYRYLLSQVCGSATLIGDLSSLIDVYYQVYIQDMGAEYNTSQQVIDSFIYIHTKTQQFIMGNEYGLATVHKFSEQITEKNYNPEDPNNPKIDSTTSNLANIKLFLVKPVNNDGLYHTPLVLGKCNAMLYDNDKLNKRNTVLNAPFGKSRPTGIDKCLIGEVELIFMHDQLLVVKDGRLYYPPICKKNAKTLFFPYDRGNDKGRISILQINYLGDVILLHQPHSLTGTPNLEDGSLVQLINTWSPVRNVQARMYAAMNIFQGKKPNSSFSRYNAEELYNDQILFVRNEKGFVKGKIPLISQRKAFAEMNNKEDLIDQLTKEFDFIHAPSDESFIEDCIIYEIKENNNIVKLAKSKIKVTIGKNPYFSVYLEGTNREILVRQIDASMPVSAPASGLDLQIVIPGYILSMQYLDSRNRIMKAMNWGKMLSSAKNCVSFNDCLCIEDISKFKASIIDTEASALRKMVHDVYLKTLKANYAALNYDRETIIPDSVFEKAIPNIRIHNVQKSSQVTTFQFDYCRIFRTNMNMSTTINTNENVNSQTGSLGPVEGIVFKIDIAIYLENDPSLASYRTIDWIHVTSRSTDNQVILSCPLQYLSSFYISNIGQDRKVYNFTFVHNKNGQKGSSSYQFFAPTNEKIFSDFNLPRPNDYGVGTTTEDILDDMF